MPCGINIYIMKTHNNGIKIKRRFLELKCGRCIMWKEGYFFRLFLEVKLIVKWVLVKNFFVFKLD